MPVVPVQEKRAFQTARITGRVSTDFLFGIPARLLLATFSLFFILLALLCALFLTKYMHDNYQTFQKNVRDDPTLQQALIDMENTFIGLYNLSYKITLFGIEIWNYMVPCINLLVYIFYRIVIGVLLTLFGAGIDQNNDGSGAGIPYGFEDPVGILTSGTDTLLNLLECILIDILTLLAGCFKVIMRALGTILIAVFNWLEQNLRQQWYRKEYCRRGAAGDYGDDWSTSTDPDSGRTIFDDGSGPGNTCPDNSALIQGLIHFVEMVVNIIRDVFLLVFPIIADLLKMVFDALLKVLPQIMEGIVKIIELFGPDKPLGKFLMFMINFMIHVVGFFIRSCVLQLIMAVSTCYFNIAIALVTNIIHGFLEGLADFVCGGGTWCDSFVPGDYVRFPSCDWSSFTNCIEDEFDSFVRNITGVCQVSTCKSALRGSFRASHVAMSSKESFYSSTEDYQSKYYSSCLAAHAKNKTSQEETVEGHLFCRYLSEEVHTPTPLGIDPSTVVDPYEDGTEFCEDLHGSCICKYASPICESQQCCLSIYHILVLQIMEDMSVKTCGDWERKQIFAQAHCISRTYRSLELAPRDLFGAVSHCDGFVVLMNQTCYDKPNETEPDMRGVVGGLCNWVDQAGFCDGIRRPNDIPEGLDQIAQIYNDQISDMKRMRATDQRRAGFGGLDPSTGFSPFSSTTQHFYADHFAQLHHDLEDQYDVVFFVMSYAFPILQQMVIQKSFDRALGLGEINAKLDPSVQLPDGRFRAVRKLEKAWRDVGESRLRAVGLNGMTLDWHFLGEHGGGDGYTPASGCTSTSGNGYVDDKTFKCSKDRIQLAGNAVGAGLRTVIAPGQAQDSIDDMIEHSSSQIYARTTNRDTFQVPSQQYVDIMYNQDVQAPSHWESSDAERDNQNPNWRQPLTRKDVGTTQNRPSDFIIYGAKPKDVSMEECPIPVNFPWEKVFKKRTTFLTPLQTFIKKIPEWTDRNVPDRPTIEIPKEIKDGMHMMYGKRKNNLRSDAGKVAAATTKVIRSFADIQTNWESIKQKAWNNTKEYKDNGWEGMPRGGFFGMDDNPQGSNTPTCVNRLLNPYECCTDDATAYECCFGLVGCIPPLPLHNVSFVTNVDFIVDAHCSSTSDVILSLFMVPRYIFGAWFWTLIFVSPPWLRKFLFYVFYPLVYDNGGLGIGENFATDTFCFVVNSYYIVLVLIGIVGLFILDFVVFTFVRELFLLGEVARIDGNVSKLKEQSEWEKKYTNTHFASTDKEMSELKKKEQ